MISMSQSFLRNASWFRKGLREFTRSGYDTASRNFTGGDLVADLKGRYYMVTGSNSGIGYCIALNVARAGGTVYMVCRNEQRGNAAREEIIRETNNQNVYLFVCDLSRTKDVLCFCSEFSGAASPLDVLVHNAGCMVNTRTLNDDNMEVNFATNTLALYIMTLQLVPILDRSSDPRVVTVSSGGMLTVKLETENLNSTKGKFDGTFVYAQNKRQQLVIMRHFARKFVNIHFSTMHPGWADTPAVQTSMPKFHFLMRSKLRTPQQGADTAHWLAVTPRIREFPTGSFFQDRVVVPEHISPGTHSTEAEEQRLMDQLEEILLRYLPKQTSPPAGATPLLSQEVTGADGSNIKPTQKDTVPTDPTPNEQNGENQ